MSSMPTAPLTIDLPLKLDDERLSPFLEILDYATFTYTMQLKMRHISCWNIPFIASLEISFNHYFKTDVASRISFN